MERLLRIVLLPALLVGCGGGSTPISEYGDNCSPGGIWRAADGTLAIVDESPRGHLIQADGVQFVGDLAGVDFDKGRACFLDRDLSVLHVALPIGKTLPDSSVEAKGKANGSWAKRAGSLQLDANLDTGAGGRFSLSFVGAYDALHGQPSSRGAIAGSYRPATNSDTEVLTVDAAGQVFSQNAITGCVINGSLDPVDAHFNVYRAALTFSSCQGILAALNGAPAKGLATYDARKSPAELFIALDVAASRQHYSVVQKLKRL